MMKHLVPLSLILAGCASAPKLGEAPKPTYTEKVATQDLSSVDAKCPADAHAHGEWRTLVPMANACVKDGQWAKVEAFGNVIATSAPLVPWGAYFLSLAASARQDYARAQWMIELALKKSPDQALFHYELGRIYWVIGDDAGVIKEMKTAASLGPALADAHVIQGQLARRRGDVSEARKELRAALGSEPKNLTALLALADVELTAKDYAAAEDVLANAIKVDPRHAGARLALAEVQETHLRKAQEALTTLKEIRHLAEQRKLDGQAPVGLNERIQNLEKSLSQVKRDQVSQRQPSGERVTK